MSAPDTAQDRNTQALGAALAQLRSRLERFVARFNAPQTPGAQDEPSEPAAETPPSLATLGERLGLSAFEQSVLLLCAAPEFDTRISSLCARAQDDASKNYPTFGLALALFEDASWDVLSPERPLRYWRLIEIARHSAQPLTASALRADERILNYLKGLNYLDERLASVLIPGESDAEKLALAPSQAAQVKAIVERWKNAGQETPLEVVQLAGTDTQSKILVAENVAAQLNRRLYRLSTESLPTNLQELETLSRLWQRESRLLPIALYLDATETSGIENERHAVFDRLLSRTDGPILVGIREALPHLGCDSFTVEISKPTVAEQRAAWQEALGDQAGDSPSRLSAQFNANLPEIRRMAAEALQPSEQPVGSSTERIWQTCRAQQRPRMDALAQRLEPKVGWDDLVLPPEEMNQLRQIAAQVGHRHQVYHDWGFDRKMNRGFSISALFAGDSGTGKTMAAEVIANELSLDLYRIDLSAVVNKYIGETEKNLRRLFDAAEEGGAILFFDEADALFGKRSEVKDSHDRYANIEINYLLQRIESYSGLAILATNTKSALDTAFVRRLRFIVNFPQPGINERRQLWQKVFLQPDAEQNLPAPPLDELDYDHLAKLNLSGGHIHNAALNAAFRAAAEYSKVTMRIVLDAVRGELLKLGRPFNEADFIQPKSSSRSASEKAVVL